MRGFCECIADPYIPPKGVVGIVVAKSFPDRKLVQKKLLEGIEKLGDSVVWIMRTPPPVSEEARENDASSAAWDIFEKYGIEPLIAAPVKYVQPNGRSYADNELLRLCERLIVFHDKGSSITKYFVDHPYTAAKVFVIERGKRKTTVRRGRKPAGV